MRNTIIFRQKRKSPTFSVLLKVGLSYALRWGLCVALLLRSLGRLVAVDLGLDARGQIATVSPPEIPLM